MDGRVLGRALAAAGAFLVLSWVFFPKLPLPLRLQALFFGALEIPLGILEARLLMSGRRRPEVWGASAAAVILAGTAIVTANVFYVQTVSAEAGGTGGAVVWTMELFRERLALFFAAVAFPLTCCHFLRRGRSASAVLIGFTAMFVALFVAVPEGFNPMPPAKRVKVVFGLLAFYGIPSTLAVGLATLAVEALFGRRQGPGQPGAEERDQDSFAPRV